MLRRTALAVVMVFPSGLGIAQTVPEFDEYDFQIVSIEPGSNAIIRSNDRDFYCSLERNDVSGYIRFNGCLPFVNQYEADEADRLWLENKVAADAAEAEQARKAAELAEAEREEEAKKFAQLTEGFTIAMFADAMEAIALRNGCEMVIGQVSFENPDDFTPLLLELGISSDLDLDARSAFKQMAKAAMADLYKRDRIAFFDRSSKIRLKECN